MPLLLCPNDNTAMQEIDRNGVKIDVCPECRGVWLDRGELEKLLDLVGREPARERGAADPARRDEPRYDERRHEERRRDEHRPDDRGYEYRKRKKRFEIFDFFD